MSAAVFEFCRTEDYDNALALIDHEFLRAKNRPGRISERFPSVFKRENPSNVLVARMPHGIASVLVLHDTAIDRGRVLRQIGMVTTSQRHRGQGLASNLLRFAQSRIDQDRVHEAVLWTNARPFYLRLGWRESDVSCLAVIEGSLTPSPRECGVIDADRIRLAEAIRREWAVRSLPRSTEGWLTVPPHADEAELIFDDNGFALVGKRNDTGFLYELCGPRRSWPLLWKQIRDRYRHIIANGHLGDAWVRWMASENRVVWRENRLGMRFMPNIALNSETTGLPYFPVVDRI